ncbi:SitI3 family protein [Paenibacillus sp. Leaf72]|uniref:SitI3 family protein n=1 Tax=Paenibacillus sp. Leaf72 TaxID=1736234 RepID=UPI0006F3ACB8|nr:SitI3 family protein [Paenibacillus sp. Leaf72]KQO04483.1 hypothetical protein ASF12_13180 [Paenibacillus sp. Leaf72]
MATEYSLKMEDDTLTQEILIDELELLGYCCEDIVNLKNGIQIANLFNELGFYVFLMATSDLLYGWESEFLENDFKNLKRLDFRLNNEYDTELAVVNMFAIIFNILSHINTNVLLLLNDTDILYRNNGEYYINNEFGYWDNENYHRFIEKLNYKNLKPIK